MKCLTPISVENKRYKDLKPRYPNVTRYNLVPCGKCVNCLKNYINTWVYRFQLESRSCTYSYFVTLTYDDSFLPSDGVSKSEIQKFFKRVRKGFLNSEIPLELKYFCISEYGPTTFRPHYHFLAFSNLPIFFENYWNKGFVTQDDVLTERFVYVAKYHVIKGQIQVPGKNPTFSLISNGIGFNAFKEIDLVNAKNNVNFIYNDDGFRLAIPKFFKDKFNLPKYVNPIINSLKGDPRHYDFNIKYNTELFVNKLSKKSKL